MKGGSVGEGSGSDQTFVSIRNLTWESDAALSDTLSGAIGFVHSS
jgi:hypothetical protein